VLGAPPISPDRGPDCCPAATAKPVTVRSGATSGALKDTVDPQAVHAAGRRRSADRRSVPCTSL